MILTLKLADEEIWLNTSSKSEGVSSCAYSFPHYFSMLFSSEQIDILIL